MDSNDLPLEKRVILASLKKKAVELKIRAKLGKLEQSTEVNKSESEGKYSVPVKKESPSTQKSDKLRQFLDICRKVFFGDDLLADEHNIFEPIASRYLSKHSQNTAQKGAAHTVTTTTQSSSTSPVRCDMTMRKRQPSEQCDNGMS